MTHNTEERTLITITLKNKQTGTTYPDCDIYLDNTLGSILKEYGKDLGLNPSDKKITFINERTEKNTSDHNETAEGLGLKTGDILVMVDDGRVG